MGSYHGKPILGCVLSNDSMQVGDKLYAAPVAAQPPFAKGSWQHAVDDQLVSFGRTSQEFDSPHDAVRWLLEQEVQAAQPQQAKPEPLSEAEILGLAEPFGAFEFGDSQGHKRLGFARATITAFCLKNGIKEQE